MARIECTTNDVTFFNPSLTFFGYRDGKIGVILAGFRL